MSSLDLSSYANRTRSDAPATTSGSTKDQKPAQFWANIGYTKHFTDDQGNDATSFVSLSMGVPIDQCKVYDLSKEHNPNMYALRRDQNQLHEMLMAECEALAPGEARIIALDEGGLSIEIKRVRGEAQAPAEDAGPVQFSFRPKGA